MTTHRLVKILSVCIALGSLFLSGCANYLQPEVGAIARPEARIELAENGVQGAGWTAKNLDLTYSYSQSGNTFNLSGMLSFDQSVTNSFPLIKRFFLKVSFLDDKGRVLETVDITPLFRYLGEAPDNLKIQSSCATPAGTSSLAFNYYGLFTADDGGNDARGGGDWEIFYFPFD